jgi:hypothetical protein
MSLRDAVSGANLSSYAEIALVIFMVVFALVALELLLSGKRHEAARSLPLDQENTHDDQRR